MAVLFSEKKDYSLIIDNKRDVYVIYLFYERVIIIRQYLFMQAYARSNK